MRATSFAKSVGAVVALVLLAGCGSDSSTPPRPTVVASVVIRAPNAFVESGDSLQLTAEARGADGAVVPGVTFQWSSTDDAVLVVSPSGLVKGLARGAASAVATATGPTAVVTGTFTAAAQLTVRQLVRRVSVTVPDSADTGDTLAVRAVAYDGAGVAIPEVTFAWSSSDTLVASLARAGRVVGLSYGPATVTATPTGPAEFLGSPASVPSASAKIDVRLAFARISIGSYHGCGVARGGIVHCWGQATWGRLGTGVNYPPWQTVATPGAVLSAMRFSSVDADEQHDSRSGHTCAIAVDGDAYCWGSGSWGMLGDGQHGEGIPVYANAFPTRVSGIPGTRQAALGAMHSCLLATDGAAWCSGSNFWGEAGVRSTTLDCAGEPCVLAFSRVAGAPPFESLASGEGFTCGLTASAQVWCWGRDLTLLRTGYGLSAPTTPVPLSSPVQFRSIAAGSSHACGIAFDGFAYCWGYDWFGQTGAGLGAVAPHYVTVPTRVVTLSKFGSIALGENHSCALTADGTAYCWGSNDHGQLGAKTTAICGDSTIPNAVLAPCSMTPIPVNTALRFVDIAPGLWHTCALTAGGEVYCWGDNSSGQLGTGDTNARATPAKVVSQR